MTFPTTQHENSTRSTCLATALLISATLVGTPAYAFFGSKKVPPPTWTSVAEHPDYPPPLYVLGVGLAKAKNDQAKDRLTADQNAFTEIVRQLTADVSSAITIDAVEVQSGRINSYWERVSAGSIIRSSLSVNGLTVVDRHYDSKAKLYYSLGVLDRRIAADPYLRQLEQTRSDSLSHLATADRFEGQGQVFQAIFGLREAYRAACRYQDVLPALQLVSGSSGLEQGLAEAPSVVVILDRLSATLAGIRLHVASGNGQAFVHNHPLIEPLVVKLTSGGDRLLPAAGVTVEFRFRSGGGGLFPMTAATDRLGVLSTTARKVINPSDESCVVSGSVSFRELLDNSAYAGQWNSRVPVTPMTVLFELHKKKAPTGTEVLTVVANKSAFSGSPTTTRELLTARLAQAGFLPATNADPERMNLKATPEELCSLVAPNVCILLYVEITSDSVNDAMGMKVCNLGGSLKAFRVKDAKPLATLAFDRIRGFGMQDATAREDAYKKVADELSERLIEALLAVYE